VVNIGASALATVIATERFGDLGPGIAVGVLTFLILVFGEITPKSLATRYSERISLFVAPLMFGLMRAMSPLVWLFSRLTTWISRLTEAGGVRQDPIVTETELITMAEHGEEEGTIESDERQMIERVFLFSDLRASDVMTPRRQMVSLYGRTTLRDALPAIVHGNYSRIPLFDDNPDEIRKILYLRDVLRTLADKRLDTPLIELGRDPLYVIESHRIDELIGVLQRTKTYMAVVVDEHGVTQGLVTMEDLVEELVGEIYDESDEIPEQLMPLGEDQVVVDGTAELRAVEAFFHVDLPGKPTDTVNRWVLENIGRIPAKDEHFMIDGLDVRVQAASIRRIHQVVLTRESQTGSVEPKPRA
jgi:CBS domain containing-hemolysin-like protein